MSHPIERALRSSLPDRTVENVAVQTTRPGNETGFVTFVDADPVYVKTAMDDSNRLVRETAAMRYAAEHCFVEVPSIVAADPTAELPYLVTKPLPGTIFNDRWTGDGDWERLCSRLGEVVAGVHAAEFADPGSILGGAGDSLDLATGSWPDVLCETIEWRESNWFADRFDDMPGRVVEAVRAVDPTLDETTPTLLHGDPSRINVHLDPDGLLDWERALVGDPSFGLVEAAFHHASQGDVPDEREDELTAAIFDGYRERAGDLPATLDRYRDLYRLVAYLLVPQTFDDWSDQAERPLDEVEADVRDEFDDRLAAIDP